MLFDSTSPFITKICSHDVCIVPKDLFSRATRAFAQRNVKRNFAASSDSRTHQVAGSLTRFNKDLIERFLLVTGASTRTGSNYRRPPAVRILTKRRPLLAQNSWKSKARANQTHTGNGPLPVASEAFLPSLVRTFHHRVSQTARRKGPRRTEGSWGHEPVCQTR